MSSSSAAVFHVSKLEILLKGGLFSEMTLSQLCSMTDTRAGHLKPAGSQRGLCTHKATGFIYGLFFKISDFWLNLIKLVPWGQVLEKPLCDWRALGCDKTVGSVLSLNVTGCVTTAASF